MINIKKEYENSLDGLTFIDLFSGIGGFRLALESFGAKCVYSLDIDKHACSTYEANFGEYPLGDIRQTSIDDIPTHDILCAGFPCQAFSISGKKRGFEDTRGTLFFEIARIITSHKPKILLLENVKNLKNHDNGKTFEIIRNTLKKLGYNVYYKIINGSRYNIPQARERIYIIAIRCDIDNNHYKFPKEIGLNKSLLDLLVNDDMCEDLVIEKEYTLNSNIQKYSQKQGRPLRVGSVNKGGQGDRIYSPYSPAITLSAEGGGTGSKTGLYLIDGKVRKLHPRETARLMGFPDSFKINPSNNQAYKQFGNSVIVDVIQYILESIVEDRSIYNES